MDTENLFRRLRGAAGNALVWGAGWATLGAATFTALKVTGILPNGVSWLDGIGIAVKFGFIGGIAGGAFSGVIGFLYRGRRLSDIRAVRFGVGGGILAGLFVPAFLQTMNLLSGDGFVPMRLVLDDSLMAAVFGAVAAGASLTLAQRAAPRLSAGSQNRPGRLAGGNPLASAGERDRRGRRAPA